MKKRTGFTCVYFTNGGQKYRAIISVKNKSIHLGTFGTAEEAAKAYEEAVVKYRGQPENK